MSLIERWECPEHGSGAVAMNREGGELVTRCYFCGAVCEIRKYVPDATYRGAVEALESLRPLLDACGDGGLDRPWNTDALVKLAKGVRTTLGGQS